MKVWLTDKSPARPAIQYSKPNWEGTSSRAIPYRPRGKALLEGFPKT